MDSSSLLLLSLVFMQLVSAAVSPAALTVSPSRSQFFRGESVTLTCEDGWTVRRNTTLETRTQCGDGFGRSAGSTCEITSHPDDSGMYWCESTSGSSPSSSSSIQLSVSGGSVILQSPVLPVMEGDDVTLSCRAKSPAHNLPAAFYKDKVVIGHGASGNFTLKTVKRSDEGFYKCSISGQGESPSSRISVEEKPSTTSGPSPPSSSSPSSQSHLFMLLTPPCVIFGFYSQILVLLIQLLRTCEGTDPHAVYASVKTNDVKNHQRSRTREFPPEFPNLH